jgi:hypothetical protein
MPQKGKTDLAQEGKNIVKRIDDLIESCKKEIRLRKLNYSGRGQSDSINKSLDVKTLEGKSGRFGFKTCIKTCLKLSDYETYKKYYTRAKNGKASKGDIEKLEYLYEKMQEIYGNTDTLFHVPPLPSNTTILPQSLRNLLRKVSKEFDKQLEKEQNK